MKISQINTILISLVLIGTAYGQNTCSANDMTQCQNSVPPGPAGIFSYKGCQRTSTRLRTCLYNCNTGPCNTACTQVSDYRLGYCMYDTSRQTISCLCYRN